jgi:SHS2 domain-containing protein
MTPAGLRAYAGSARPRAEAFEQAAIGMTAVITDLRRVEARKAVAIECEAPDRELLFAEWLNSLIYEMSTRRRLFSRFSVSSSMTNGSVRRPGASMSTPCVIDP